MNLCGQTLMPAFSEIQNDVQRTNRILVQVSSLIMLLGLPALVFMLFCGRSVLMLAYGSRYGGVPGALEVASCVALINLLNGQITTVFYAQGHPHLHRRAVAAMAIAMVLTSYPLARILGPQGGQAACLLAATLGYILQFLRLKRLTRPELAVFWKAVIIATLTSTAAVAINLCGPLISRQDHPVTKLAFGSLALLLAYTATAANIVKSHARLSQT
jgi:O-antigen/teichoic acid export membrane protein